MRMKEGSYVVFETMPQPDGIAYVAWRQTKKSFDDPIIRRKHVKGDVYYFYVSDRKNTVFMSRAADMYDVDGYKITERQPVHGGWIMDIEGSDGKRYGLKLHTEGGVDALIVNDCKPMTLLVFVEMSHLTDGGRKRWYK
jgi:hypothetical protein